MYPFLTKSFILFLQVPANIKLAYAKKLYLWNLQDANSKGVSSWIKFFPSNIYNIKLALKISLQNVKTTSIQQAHVVQSTLEKNQMCPY